ncbi:TetR family transcriptional regulator [Nocardia rhamnosiphila]|uniref:TetR/AcrR family transcriptional regulator n=1 Tax=Nocardia rhamnosiphila TaxID=426716 RepID=UPI003404CBF1
MADAALDRPPLRERKKLRTRQALVDTALELFTENGFDSTTLDELCDAVEVSKRTFFRTFTSKEDVAMAPLRDLWAAFLHELETHEPGTGSLYGILQDRVLAALQRMPAEGWAGRAARSHRLAQSTPSMGANNLQFCDRTVREALEILHHRFGAGLPADQRTRLALDIVVAAFHCGMEAWSNSSGKRDIGSLANHLRGAFAAAPEALVLVPGPRAAD